ncbi:MAG: hypothetical protein FWG39_01770 [Alphaproteobacteria bacterium]|nr:hypothetical protein [Alphaproteobacteria bacterium]
MAKKQIEIIDMGGAKTVARKKSWTRTVNSAFLGISIVWLSFAAWAPLHVKNTYGTQIKKSIVVSMFFDVQRNMNEQYEKLMRSIGKAINLEKPVAIAVDKMKIADKGVAKVETAAQKTTQATQKLTGLAAKVGVNTAAADKATASVSAAADQTKIINQQLDKIKGELTRVAQTEIDKAIDDQVKALLDKHTGLGTTMLTNYGIKHVMPWKPSTWPVTNRIYADLEKSNVAILNSLTGMVDRYFGYVAWGLVIAAWVAALGIWFMAFGKVKKLTKPFLVCPRCGHTYADRRTGMMLLKLLKPWSWI